MNLTDQFVQDTQAPSNVDLDQIAMLAEQQLEAEAVVADLEVQLADAKRRLTEIAERALPDAMAAVGMLEFKLVTGNKITVKEDVFASIRAERIFDAVTWLDGKGLGDVVKDEVKVNLGKGEAELAMRFLALAEQLGVSATEKLSVHPATLKSLVKEQLAQGVEFPEEFFSIQPYKRSVIKPFKEKTLKAKVAAPLPVAPRVAAKDLDYSEF